MCPVGHVHERCTGIAPARSKTQLWWRTKRDGGARLPPGRRSRIAAGPCDSKARDTGADSSRAPKNCSPQIATQTERALQIGHECWNAVDRDDPASSVDAKAC